MVRLAIVDTKPVAALAAAMALLAIALAVPNTGLAAQQACLERIEPIERDARDRASLRAQVIRAKDLCRQGKEKEAMKVLVRVRNALKHFDRRGG